MEKREPTHPGIMLKEEFMAQYNLEPEDVSIMARIALPLLKRFLEGDFGVTYGVAVRLGKVFSNTPEFWLNLQLEHDKWALANSPANQAQLETVLTVERYLEIKGGKE